MKRKRDNFICTFCYRKRPRRVMKRDVDCSDSNCTEQHWMCRSERDCQAAMERRK